MVLPTMFAVALIGLGLLNTQRGGRRHFRHGNSTRTPGAEPTRRPTPPALVTKATVGSSSSELGSYRPGGNSVVQRWESPFPPESSRMFQDMDRRLLPSRGICPDDQRPLFSSWFHLNLPGKTFTRQQAQRRCRNCRRRKLLRIDTFKPAEIRGLGTRGRIWTGGKVKFEERRSGGRGRSWPRLVYNVKYCPYMEWSSSHESLATVYDYMPCHEKLPFVCRK